MKEFSTEERWRVDLFLRMAENLGEEARQLRNLLTGERRGVQPDNDRQDGDLADEHNVYCAYGGDEG